MVYKVVFIVRETGFRVEKEYDSYFKCKRFVERAKHSKVIQLISYPVF